MVVFYNSLNRSQLMRAESRISGEGKGREPELRALIIAIDMNVGRLVGLMAKEIECIRTNPENCRHGRRVAISNAGNKFFLTELTELWICNSCP